MAMIEPQLQATHKTTPSSLFERCDVRYIPSATIPRKLIFSSHKG